MGFNRSGPPWVVSIDPTYLTPAEVAAMRRGSGAASAVVFGDSYSSRTNSNGAAFRQSDHAYWTWANLLLGSPMRLVANLGINGNTTTQMLNRIYDVHAANAEYVFVQGGINDLSASATADTVVANLVAICESLRQRSKVILLNLAPNTAYTGSIVAINAALANYAVTVGNVFLVDVFSAVVNPTDSTGPFASGMSNDALHLTAAGARAYGAAIDSAIRKFVAVQPFLPASMADYAGTNANSRQILANPLMTGSAGTVSGTGASGTLASSWAAGTDTGTVTSVWLHEQTRSDGLGFDQQVTVSNAAENSTINMRQNTGLTTRVVAGDTIFACGSISLTGMVNVSRVQPSVTVTIDGTTSVLHCLDNSDTTFSQSDVAFNWRTPEFVLSAVPSALSLFFRIRFGAGGNGACVAKFGRTGLYRRLGA